MLALSLAINAPPAPLSPPPAQARVAVVDATPPFWRFWAKAQGKPESERVRLFRSMVVDAHPELFGTEVLNGAKVPIESKDKEADALIAAYLRDVAPFIVRMKSTSAQIHQDFGYYSDDFVRTFPRYSPVTTVYFTVSLFFFDGATRPVRGKTALLFGIDGIARFHPADANLKVFFDHELFHQYHDQVQPELSADEALWTSLWQEGLATYVSQQMNPGATVSQALMSSSLAADCEPKLPTMAAELLRNIDSTDPKEYAAFFYGNNGRADVPSRAGYYVGYRVVQELAGQRSLEQLAELRGEELKESIRHTLQEMAR